jgi:hypothetical protein
MMVIKESGEVVVATVDAMKSVPLALALLVVNVGFLGFASFVLGRVADNAADRNKSQTELIEKLAVQCMPVAPRKETP